jgi:hypothetical protein
MHWKNGSPTQPGLSLVGPKGRGFVPAFENQPSHHILEKDRIGGMWLGEVGTPTLEKFTMRKGKSYQKGPESHELDIAVNQNSSAIGALLRPIQLLFASDLAPS